MATKSDRTTERVALTIAEQCVGARVRMLNRMVTRIYDDALREHGLKFSQMNILTLIATRQPVQPSEVAQVLVLEKSTLSRNVRLMEGNGWIKSSAASGGNKSLLQLTAVGQRLYRKAAPSWARAQDDVIALMGASNAKSIRAAVDHVTERVN